ncbi:MAG: sulfur carrier protein ThiS [Bacteroidota bacterium]
MNSTAPIRINGEPREVPPGLTIRALLTHLGRDPDQPGVAVAVDDRVVRRALWDETAVPEGSRVEIITASQGG